MPARRVRSVPDGSMGCSRRSRRGSSRLRSPIRRRGSPGRCSSESKIIGFRCLLLPERSVQNPPQDRKVFQLGKSDYGVMQTGRNRGLDKPEALSEHPARRREWDSIRGYHQGQRPYEPRRKAGHMTAPDRPCTNAHKNSCQTGASTYDNAWSSVLALGHRADYSSPFSSSTVDKYSSLSSLAFASNCRSSSRSCASNGVLDRTLGDEGTFKTPGWQCRA